MSFDVFPGYPSYYCWIRIVRVKPLGLAPTEAPLLSAIGQIKPEVTPALAELFAATAVLGPTTRKNIPLGPYIPPDPSQAPIEIEVQRGEKAVAPGVAADQPKAWFSTDSLFASLPNSAFVFDLAAPTFVDREAAVEWIAGDGRQWANDAENYSLLRLAVEPGRFAPTSIESPGGSTTNDR